uniref:NADH-ubiquinone oxidoreductase chain 2 n=1 Tax=Cardiocondyla obscurior TaxID=286306 RepID=A0A343AXT3_9HYME|nr:NADH dehydrogenase subunit 2 [Cardiocondyla obscurior]
MMMMIFFTKFMIFPHLIFFSIFPLFIYDFFIIWFSMEILNFLFIFYLNMNLKYKKIIFLYFLIQILSSFLLLISIILNNFLTTNNLISILMTMSLMMKLSLPPFHLWLPIMSKFLTWNSMFFILTFQKISPFYMLSLLNQNLFIIYMTIFLCSLIPPMMTFNMNNLKIIISYSSINQSSWMIFLIYLKNIIWMKYFMLYLFILWMLTFLIYFFKIFKNFSLSKNFMYNLLIYMFLFNLSGLPPFTFFYLKWYSIFIFMNYSNLFLIFILMMTSSFFMLFIYLNLSINIMYLFSMNSKLIKFNIKNNLTFMPFLIMSLLMSMIIYMI